MKSYNFDFDEGEFVLNKGCVECVADEEALRLWISKILRTQLDRYRIYKGTGYGADIEDLVMGKSYGVGFAEAELKRELEEALLKNDEIIGIKSADISRKGDALNIEISLSTVYGELEEAEVYEV